MQRTWDEREAIILKAVLNAEAEQRSVNNDDVAAATGLSRDAVDRGLLALAEANYVTGTNAAAEELCYLLDIGLLERGRRATGQWPSDDPAEELIAALRERIEQETDPVERSRLERLRDALGEVSKSVVAGLVTAAAKSLTGWE